MTRKFSLLLLSLVFSLSGWADRNADAQTVTVLHNFGNGANPSDGYYPIGSIIQGNDGNFYGTTYMGGTNNVGVVFKITSTGMFTVLHDFSAPDPSSGKNADGAYPDGSLVQGADGNFYGISEGGGLAASGTVFKITASGALTTLVNFTGTNGGTPATGLIQGSDGNFYGTTYFGGASSDGTVYRVTPSGTLTTLVSFTGANGAYPYAALLQGSDGNFYGDTQFGGSTLSSDPNHRGFGTVFKMAPAGTLTLLHNFNDGTIANDGTVPTASLVQGNDGNFYSTTDFGGGSLNNGVIFKITPTGVYTILNTVTDLSDGDSDASATLMRGRDGNFYGTEEGGDTNDGAVFEMTPMGVFTFFHSFGNGIITNNPSGPVSPLVQGTDGNFYGTSEEGGIRGGGTVFELTIVPLSLIVTSLSPASTSVGGPAFTLIITGTGFTSNSTVTFDGIPVTVTARTATQLTVAVPASAIATFGAKTVTVTDPADGTASAIFTLIPGWNVQDVAAVSDGTARLLWDREDGAAGIWIMNASDGQAAVGPTYGPYQGWSAQDVTAAGDGTSRILWNRYDGATGVWVMDAHGNQITVGPTYGPFTGWKAIDLAAAPDGTSRLLWRYTNGQAGLLSLNTQGTQVISGRSYGPYTGWTATAVGAAGDGTARILWTRSDGAMGIWTMDAGDLQKAVGPTYGPYSDSHGHWTATDLSTSADGSSQVLWKRSDGAMGVWTFSAANTAVTSGTVYGPYPEWTAAAMDAANDKARVLWVNSNRTAGLWSFGSNDAETLIGPIYGPY